LHHGPASELAASASTIALCTDRTFLTKHVLIQSNRAKVQQALADMRAASRERIRARIRRGITDGDVPPGTDVGALADFYSAVLTGMSQQARDGASRRILLSTVKCALGIFPRAKGWCSCIPRIDCSNDRNFAFVGL